MNSNTTCGYRRFKLFIPGEKAVQYVLDNAAAFHLMGKYSVYDSIQHELPLHGYWGNNYKIRVSISEIKNLGIGIELMGDFQKFFKDGQDDNGLFTWTDFINSVKALVAIVQVEPEEVHMINLKGVMEVEIPDSWNTSAIAIVNRILRFKGKYNYRQDKDSTDKEYSVEFSYAEYLYEVKGFKKKAAPNEPGTVQISIEIKKSSYLKDRGIVFLSDIMKKENHEKLLNSISELFGHLIIYQDDVDNELLMVEEQTYCREYNKSQAWNELHKQDPHKYKYLKKKMEAAIARVCPVSFKNELQRFISAQLSNPTEAVPDFPLYIEKRGMPLPSVSAPSANYIFNAL